MNTKSQVASQVGTWFGTGALTALIVAVALSFASVGLGAAPQGWLQVHDDGFFGPPSDTRLVVFDGSLYANSDHGTYRMESAPCGVWQKLNVPVSKDLRPLGNQLYALDQNARLWFRTAGNSNWLRVTHQGLPSEGILLPHTLFKGQIYAVREYSGSQGPIAEVWRSQDVGKTVMKWQRVVRNSFNDPENNRFGLTFLTVFNNHIYAGTNALKSTFGDPGGHVTGGVEVWESATGNAGSWNQINQDGFGTTTSLSDGTILRTNQVIGSWSVFKGSQSQAYLYIGTKSHFGAEVWRYDGTGLAGWTNVTPPGRGPGPFGGPSRNESMTVFQNHLYLAEGYPFGSLSRYDGQSWTAVVPATAFHADNGGFTSAVALQNTLYVSTTRVQGLNVPEQVWAYPLFVADFACVDLTWEGLWSLSTVDLGALEYKTNIRNGGPLPIDGAYEIVVGLDGIPIVEVPGPMLAPGEVGEVSVVLSPRSGDDVVPPVVGRHEIALTLDSGDAIEESDESNNFFSHAFSVPLVDPGSRTPFPDSLISDQEPEIGAVIVGPSGSFEVTSILLKVDGVSVEHSYEADQQLVFFRPTPLVGGFHSVELSFESALQEFVRETWDFEIQSRVDIGFAPPVWNAEWAERAVGGTIDCFLGSRETGGLDVSQIDAGSVRLGDHVPVWTNPATGEPWARLKRRGRQEVLHIKFSKIDVAKSLDPEPDSPVEVIVRGQTDSGHSFRGRADVRLVR